MTPATRPRPRTLPSSTTKLHTEHGNLYVTVSLDEDGEPFEVFGSIGKAGSFTSGVTEAGLPPHLPSPAPWHSPGRDRGPDAGG